jgi:hypothetical protein
VATLITSEEFVSRAVGLPWVLWRSDEVLGIDLGPVPQVDIAAGFENAPGWVEAGPEANATAWMAWHGGRPRHCGVVLPGGMLLHSEGSEDHPGSARVSRLAAVARIHGQIKFYRYVPTC